MLAAGLPLRCVALSAYGCTTRTRTRPRLCETGLKLTSETLLAFQRDLEARGLADRVLTLVWSEFGRRAEENGSHGTDHGAAGVGLLMGTRARGKMIGELPGLKTALDRDGNLKATVDFRTIYSSLLEQWLTSTDAAAVIPNAKSFGRRAAPPMKRFALLLALVASAGALPRAAPPRRSAPTCRSWRARVPLPALAASGPGRARSLIELANFGQDEHDLTVRKVGTTKVVTMPGALPGTRETATVRLKPGLYVLKCTMADHAMRGMKARLRVVPRRQPRR